MTHLTSWLFAEPEGIPTAWRVIAWWELRRIPYNIIVGVYACVCLAAFIWAITTSGHLAPGEDAIEPMAIIAAPIGINLAYTLGWMVELAVRAARPSEGPGFGPLLLKLGLVVSLVLVTLPAAVWCAVRLLQFAGIVS